MPHSLSICPQVDTSLSDTIFFIQSEVLCLQGYGPDLAFVPATINISPSEVAQYASNGNSKLPMTIQVRDQAGSPILSGQSTCHDCCLNAVATQACTITAVPCCCSSAVWHDINTKIPTLVHGVTHVAQMLVVHVNDLPLQSFVLQLQIHSTNLVSWCWSEMSCTTCLLHATHTVSSMS